MMDNGTTTNLVSLVKPETLGTVTYSLQGIRESIIKRLLNNDHNALMLVFAGYGRK